MTIGKITSHDGTRICNDTTDGQIRRSCIMDIPTEVLVENILMKLPLKSLVLCKRVCKSWRHLILSPQFGKMHYSVQPKYTSLLIQDNGFFYLMEQPEDEFSYELRNRSRIEFNSTRLKIPLFSTHVNVFNSVSQDPDGHPQGKNILINRFMKPEDQKYRILNSLNGLLCLAAGQSKEPVAVCNPVVGEFMALPIKPRIDQSHRRIKYEVFRTCGLGFSQKHNQYKVIRTFDLYLAKDPDSYDFTNQGTWGEVLTLETGSSWKSVGSAPNTRQLRMLHSPTYIHGALHWLSNSMNNNSIAYFDFDNDKFGFHSLPPLRYLECTPLLTISILEDCLCLCDFTSYCYMDVWIMKEYGVSKSWTKLLSVNIIRQGYCCGYYIPLSYSIERGTLLLFHSCNALIYYSLELLYIRDFQVCGPDEFEFQAIVHTPSLISLKDIVNSSD